MFSLHILDLDTILKATSFCINTYPLRLNVMFVILARMEGEIRGVSDPVSVGYTINGYTNFSN